MAEVKVTAADICKALKNTYASPEWNISFEVGNGTGSLCRRHADAIAVNMYPSRGYEIRGFEIKVSRSDLKHEIEQAEKAEEVAKYCDYWFLVVPKGLTDNIQIPLAWGIIEYNDGKLRIKKQAQELQKEPIKISFTAALLRAQERLFESELSNKVAQIVADNKASWEKSFNYQANQNKKDYEKIIKKVKEIKELSGIDLLYWTDAEGEAKYIKLAKKLRKCDNLISNLDYAIDNADKLLETIKNAKKELTD